MMRSSFTDGYQENLSVERKCANIVLAYGFGRQAIPVDTHVNRISKHHGKKICNPVRPKCGECPLRELCPYAKGLVKKNDIK